MTSRDRHSDFEDQNLEFFTAFVCYFFTFVHELVVLFSDAKVLGKNRSTKQINKDNTLIMRTLGSC